MKVIGIDPAPKKPSTIFDGDEFKEHKKPDGPKNCGNYELFKSEFDDLMSKNENILVCWDAPLTAGLRSNSKGLYIRQIEVELKESIKKKSGGTTLEGISVLPFAGCPHWAISQMILGYPDLAVEDNFKNKKLKLISKVDFTENGELIDSILKGKILIEVHPAVALYFWLGDSISDWRYKKKLRKEVKERLLVDIKEELKTKGLCSEAHYEKIITDDHLDAWTAWKLGDLLVNEPQFISFIYTADGCMLMPVEIQNYFDNKSK